MSFVMVDKENASELYHTNAGSGNRKFGDAVKVSQQMSTPQHKLKLKLQTNTEKRRALGDLINTSRHSQMLPNCVTPKGNLSAKYGSPVTGKSIKKLTRDFERHSIGLVSATKTEQVVEEQQQSYPPVEKCVPQVDTFSDLFEVGKISDIFVGKNITYVPRLPAGKMNDSEDVEKFHGFEIYTDKKWEKDMKEMKKSMKSQQKKENEECLELYQEMPEFLDLPPILEDFDLTLGSEEED